jgi:hypothetical protein
MIKTWRVSKAFISVCINAEDTRGRLAVDVTSRMRLNDQDLQDEAVPSIRPCAEIVLIAGVFSVRRSTEATPIPYLALISFASIHRRFQRTRPVGGDSLVPTGNLIVESYYINC